jgi:integrase
MPSAERSLASPPLSPNLPLSEACETYLLRRKPYLTPRSFAAYQYHFRTLQKFFDPNLPLSSFHEQHFRDYQKWRSDRGACPPKAGSSLINHELGALSQILALADLWHPISKYYERLPERDWAPPRVLSAEEEDRFFRFAARKPEWKTALQATLVTANSTIFGCELRTLRLEHLRLDQRPPVIRVPTTVKNRYRVRAVPLNAVALAAVRELLAQAKQRGAREPQHYLVPFRVKTGLYDPGRAASATFMRTAFRKIARSCGLPWITPRCFRHQAITKLLESGVPDETVRAIAGHNSERAMRYYSHIRIEAKKEAVERLEPERQAPSHGRSSSDRTRFPLLVSLRASAKKLGISEAAALELILSYERSQAVRQIGGPMEQQTKEYIRALLSLIKNIYAENYALRAMNEASPIEGIRKTWEQSLQDILRMPETQQEIDGRFDPQIERIMQLLDDQEAVASLLKLPAKGLPN